MEMYNFMSKTCLAGHNHIFLAYHLWSCISAYCLWSKSTDRYTFLINKGAVLEKLTVNQSLGWPLEYTSVGGAKYI